MRLVLAVFAVLLLACHRPTDRSAPSGGVLLRGSSGRATVEYQPTVKRVKRAVGLGALRAVSKEGSTLLFGRSLLDLHSLRRGDVLLVEGLLARKVLATDTIGGDIAVLTEPATLGETIRNGRIELNAKVQFAGELSRAGQAAASAWDRLGAVFVSHAHAQKLEDLPDVAKDVVEGIYKGWDTRFSAVPEKGRLNLSIHLTRNVGGFKALITGDGYLSDFEMDSGIEVEHGVVEQLEMSQKRLNGVMNFRWEVAKDSPGPEASEDRIKLPAAISIPLYELLGGLPLFLEISSAMIIKPAISGGKQYSRGAFRITYDGYQSFQIKQGTIDPAGNVTGDIQFLESQNISAVAPFGMVVAFAAPRIELTFGTSKVMDLGGIKQLREDLATAAEIVDTAAHTLVRRTLGEEGLDRLKSSLGGSLSLSQAVSNSLASDAAGYLELVASTGMSHTGMSAIVPCTRHDMNMVVKVGASAQAFGQQIGKVGTDVFKRHVVRIDPPGTRLCESVGSGDADG
jgi:hypothetical protein